MRRSTWFCLGILLALVHMDTTWAKSEGGASSSAGVLEKQVQREFNVEDLSATKQVPLIEIDIPEEKLDIPEGISAYIEHITLEGNTCFSEKKINKIVSPYLNRDLTGKDVLALCHEIDNLYATHGYILAWTYPPVQTIQDHTLTLRVIEGYLEEIEIAGNISYKTSYIRKFVAHLENKPVNYNEVMKAVLLLNENSDLSIKAVLKKGKDFGGVALALSVQDKRPVQVSAGYNNWGSSATTYNQLSSEIDVGNVLMSGDTLTMMTSVGVPPVFYFLNPVYSMVLNGSGSKLSLSYLYSFSNIQQMKSLDLTGYSEVGTVAFTQPLARTREFDSNCVVSFDIKQAKNLQAGQTETLDKLRVLTLGGSLDYIDSLKGRNFFDSYFHAGIPNILGASHASNPQSSREGAGGRYFIFNTNFQRIQPMPGECSLVFSGSAQGTFNLLPSPEQFVIGGAGTVRGYPSGCAVGDNGYFSNLEFYIPPPFIKDYTIKFMNKKWKEALQLLAFCDHGGVYNNKAVPGELSPAYLTAVGAGLRFYGPHNLNISFDAAFPLTEQYKLFNSFFYVRVNMAFF